MRPDVPPSLAFYLQPPFQNDPNPNAERPTMEKDTNTVSAQIARDYSSGLIYYTMSQGKTMSCIEVSSRSLPIPAFPNSPASSQFSSGTSDTGSSPGTWVDRNAYENHLPLQVKDSKLQAYFFRMEKTLRTCHPAALHTEALNLTRNIVAEPANFASSIRTVAETLAKAGYRKVEYSRSCALIAHEIFWQLQSTSHDTSILFGGYLIDAVMKVFDGYYFKTGLWCLGGLDGLTSVEGEMINVAAFAGDLFALGLLPLRKVHESIIANLAYANQVSTVHCRALHLFLLHAKAHIGSSIELYALGDVRRQLIRCTRGSPMAYDRMAQLWVIECCEVIDQMIEQDRVACLGEGPAAVSYQWDRILSKGSWFSILMS